MNRRGVLKVLPAFLAVPFLSKSVAASPTKKLDDVIAVSSSDGNWNYDPYMHGMANGLICARAILRNEEPKYLDAPKTWLGSPANSEVAKAYDVLAKALASDEGFRQAYLANIAMMIYDDQRPASETERKLRLDLGMSAHTPADLRDVVGCNVVAEKILNHIFPEIVRRRAR